MPRPKEFDRGEALKAAIGVFWEQGFERSSAEDLTRAMGISRQSLYDTFGSKRNLYLEALRAYSSESVADLISRVRRIKSPLEALKHILLAPADLPRQERAKGCLGINSICEFGVADTEVNAASFPSGAALEAAIIQLVREAKGNGEVGADVDEKVAANFMRCLLSGLKVAARSGTSPNTMQRIVDMALGTLTNR